MKTFDDRKQCVQAYMAQIQKNRRKTAVMVTSLTLVASILALVLFLPYSTTPPSVEQYANSEYYDLIQKINIATYHKPKYKNNFQSLVAFCTEFDLRNKGSNELMESPMPDAVAPTEPNAAPGYVEVTDNQVAGVVESDIFKRTDKYVYYLRNKTLFVYSIAQEASELVAS